MRKTRSKIMLYLIFAPFFLMGLVLLALSVRQVAQHLASQSWVSTPATLLGQGIAKEINADGSAAIGGASRVVGRYSYVWQGQTYQSDRLSFSLAKTREWGSAADQWDRKLRAILPEPGGSLPAWVNPLQPAQAVVLRDIRWLELGAMVVFGLLMVVSSALLLWGGDPHSAPGGFSWKAVAAMGAVGLPLAGLALLLWRDGHTAWAAAACIPLVFALIGLFNGLMRQSSGH